MDAAMKLADWNGFDRRREAARARGKLLGRGLANYVESSIGSPRERAEITVTPAGRVRGRHRHAAFRDRVTRPASRRSSQCCSRFPWTRSISVLGDTDVVSVGGGSHSGRSDAHAATVFSMAAEKLIAENGKRIAGFPPRD